MTGSAPDGPDTMADEFGTMARWTHDAVRRLGRDLAIPAACRGSGTPAALDWLLDQLAPGPSARMLDVGAGLGGPAAYAREHRGVRPVCVDPEPDACRAAADLFTLPTVVGDAARLPFASGAFDVVWSLGTLCTTHEKSAWLAELRRVVRPGAHLGLLVLVSIGAAFETDGGNAFPSEAELTDLLGRGGFAVSASAWSAALADAGPRWTDAEERVEREVATRHGADRRYLRIARQEAVLASLLQEGRIRGRLVVAVAH